ncbi:hypothetical protein SDC9_103847 [bioreactor metagenome]|uniref:Uncharacterized protein n=1 Tax=bioreactor metagenome TaxID=1076179 RepID=A0A645AVA6_9ZZZZ
MAIRAAERTYGPEKAHPCPAYCSMRGASAGTMSPRHSFDTASLTENSISLSRESIPFRRMPAVTPVSSGSIARACSAKERPESRHCSTMSPRDLMRDLLSRRGEPHARWQDGPSPLHRGGPGRDSLPSPSPPRGRPALPGPFCGGSWRRC